MYSVLKDYKVLQRIMGSADLVGTYRRVDNRSSVEQQGKRAGAGRAGGVLIDIWFKFVPSPTGTCHRNWPESPQKTEGSQNDCNQPRMIALWRRWGAAEGF